MKVAIIGSRTFNDYELVCKTIKELKLETMTHMVSGGAKGADSLGKRYAKEHNIPCIIYKPDWNTHGKSAGFLRNKDIINACDIVVAFWDGKSKGTEHSIMLAKRNIKQVYIINF